MRRPFVGRDHQVRIVAVIPDHRRRMHHAALDDGVRHVEETGDELPIAIDQIGIEGGARRQVAFQHEPAFRADRHDDRVLQHLGLHQAEDLGAEIVVAVAPAQAAARHPAAAQMNALEQPRMHVDLEQRPRRDHAVDPRAFHLEAEHRPLRPLIEVGAHRRAHQVLEALQNLVVEQAGDLPADLGQRVVGLA